QVRQLALDLEQHSELRQALEQLQGLLKQLGIALIKVGGKLLAQLTLCRRRNGGDHMAPPNQGSVFGLHTAIVPSTLRSQPQCQGCDLRSARVAVPARDVVLDD